MTRSKRTLPLLILMLGLGMSALTFGCDAGSRSGGFPPPGGGTGGGDGTAPVTVTSSDGRASVRVPQGAVATGTSITVQPATGAPADPRIVLGSAYDFKPDGTQFSAPAQLSIKYDSSKVPSGTQESSLRLFTVVNSAWREVSGSAVDPASDTVSASVTHFSVYGVGAPSSDGGATKDLFVITDDETVQRYNGTTGAFIGDFTSGGNLRGSHSLAFGPDGNLYVSDELDGQIKRFDGKTGAFINNFTSGESGRPNAFTFGPDKNLYAISSGDDGQTVQRYNGTTGAFLGNFTSGSDLRGAINLAFGPDGNLYVGDEMTGSVKRFNGMTGIFINNFADTGDAGSINRLTFGPDGNLYVSDVQLRIVKRYSGQTGAFLGNFTSGGDFNTPTDLVFGPDGNLYVADETRRQVKRFDGTTGAFINNFTFGGDGGPRALAFGP